MSNSSTQIQLIQPDDWHLHIRDGDVMRDVLADTARQFARAIIMPNLKPPVTTVDLAKAYQSRIEANLKSLGISSFTPLMTLYLTDNTSAEEVRKAKDEGIVAPPVETGTGKVEAPKQEEDYDKVFTVVQIPAEFPGGLPAWTKYLERNLNRDLPVNNGAPPGKYTVVVSFIVDKNGGISEVQAENDPGYGTKEEAVRVIKKGPSWKPAVQNGRNVIYRHKQSITFQVSEE